MSSLRGAVVMVGIVAIGAGLVRAAADMPEWAYAPSPAAVAVDDGTLFTLPGSDGKYTRNEIRGRVDDAGKVRKPPADWFPGDHPPMPAIVGLGDESRPVRACALCHYPNGKGRPENANPAGLPKDYMVQQLRDMKNGLRKSADPRKTNVTDMIRFASNMTEQEMEEASAYFASLPWTPWIRVVETDTVPKTRVIGGIYLPLEGPEAGTEPIANRIIEAPEDNHQTETLRNPRSGFVAYVPVGSIKKGEALVRGGGGGKTLQCAICHGEDLHGIGSVPSIAARSPSYLVRQLYDIQVGARNGAMAALMKPVVASLTAEDMLNIAAYTASLPVPSATPRTAQQP